MNDETRSSRRSRLQVVLRLGRALRLVWKIVPIWTLVNGLLPIAGLYLMKRILDAVSASLTASHPTNAFQPLIFWILLDGRSAILISQRFSTVQMTDCIYAMERGRIVKRGTHTALLAENGKYARLYRAQVQHYQER